MIIQLKNLSKKFNGFAAGGIVDSGFKQAITGVAEGVVAAHSAYTYINENEFVCFFEDEEYKK